MKPFFTIIFALSVCLSAVCQQPFIQSISYIPWTQSQLDYFQTNGVCRLTGYDFTIYDGTNQQNQWCCWATEGQVILDFTTPNVNTNYVVKWILNSPVASVPVVTSSNMFAGSTYDAISPPMTPTGSNLCFVTGIIETNGYLRIEEVP